MLVNGEIESSSFNSYHITYGIIADNIKEYGRHRKQLVHHPTIPPAGTAVDCRNGLYVEDYSESSLLPELTCSETARHSYAVALVLKTLSEKELKNVAVIYEFNDGDLDIQFVPGKGRDRQLVEGLSAKLKQADEKNDE